MVGSSFRALLEQLREAHTFEDAASAWLRVILNEAAERCPAGVTPLRAMVHLRPQGSYQNLVVMEHGEPAGGQGASPDLVPSTSAWRELTVEAVPLVIDVTLGQGRRAGAPPGVTIPNLRLSKSRTLVQLRSRLTGLLLVLPLKRAGGRLLGAASLELHLDAAAPGDAIIDPIVEALQEKADLLALALPSLPARQEGRREPDALLPVIGARMTRLVRLMEIFAQQDEILLLSGPTGVGKSQLAVWCHAHSAIAAGPFETVVLSTLPEEMQLPSLFGWRRGAFTGAVRDTQGAVERAAGGTLFIDEIDKLSPKAQSGLLHLLESHTYSPIGHSGVAAEAQVRFIIGTNVDLEDAVADGRFLEDLYFRINVLPLRIPALSERVDEIPQWIEFMLRRRHEKAGIGGEVTCSAAATQLLVQQSWPGNLRQLHNVVRRAYAIALADDLGVEARIAVQRRHVERALSLGKPTSEEPPSPLVGDTLPTLEAAALQLLEEARRRVGWGGQLDLSVAELFPSLVLYLAYRESGDMKRAYEWVGRGSVVKSRSHFKDFRRRVGRVQELYEALGVPIDDALRQALEV